MKLTKKYTDDYYASIFEIKNDFTIGSNIIIYEINKYREQYRLYFYFQNHKLSIVYLPKIQKFLNEIYEFNKHDELHPYIQVFILRNDLDICKECINYYHLPYELLDTFNMLFSFEDDITKSFIEWIKHLTTFDFIKVLQYEYKNRKLSKKQCLFFSNYDSYFEISDYQKECLLSYETARLHLCSLYKLGLISRHKIGKKVIYKKIL